jgi:hypothetical protein
VAECEIDGRLLKRVAEIYRWLDEQVQRSSESAGLCAACGRCCDFEAFDHRLFVTLPELMYLAAHLDPGNVKAMPQSRCPYNTEGKCGVYEHRFAGCRIFCCNGDADFQSSLSEAALRRLKSLCTEFQVPYRYTDLAVALNDLARA